MYPNALIICLRSEHGLTNTSQFGEEILRMENITKIYPNGIVANKNASLSVRAGEIHALCGENGAGKSTLMKVLFGEESFEKGRIFYQGKEVNIDNPNKAIEMGIGMVHQHFMLVPSLTVAENMIIGIEPVRAGLLDLGRAVQLTKEISSKYNLPIDPKAKIEDLPVGLKQRVEILKTLLRGVKILILDEPTAVLTPQETKGIFRELKHLRDFGHTVIFISHKLGEIKELCDRVTIMRDGQTVAVCNVGEVSERDISRLMVGRDVFLSVDKKPMKAGRTVLKLRGVSCRNSAGAEVLSDINLDVREGEVLGIAGIEGNGQNELSEMITGLRPVQQGMILINGHDIKGKTVRQIRELGVGSIPQDRMKYGVVSSESIKDNVIANRYYHSVYKKGIFLDMKKLKVYADGLIREYAIKCSDCEQPVSMLSGGNTQKVVVAREFSTTPGLIVLNQPTRGIDIGAAEMVHQKIIELRDSGTATLLISADLKEIMDMSDSIIVLQDGKINAYFPDVSSVTMEELGEYMLGIRHMSAAQTREAIHEQ
jgi:ABC-type uncharacterized transport system ATPase subunit